jgi:hypothetical protein
LRLFASNYNIESGGKQTRGKHPPIDIVPIKDRHLNNQHGATSVCLAPCAIPYPNTDQQLLAQLSSLLMPEMAVG